MAESGADGDHPVLSSLPSLRASSSSSFRNVASSLRKISHDENNDPYELERVMSRREGEGEDDESELQWAAIERLPTYTRIRTSLLGDHEGGNKRTVVDITKLNDLERRMFIDNLLKKVEDDNLRLLQKLKERIDRQALIVSSSFFTAPIVFMNIM